MPPTTTTTAATAAKPAVKNFDFTPKQEALRLRYADRVAREANRNSKSASRIATWNARMRKADARMDDLTVVQEESHSRVEFGWRSENEGFTGIAHYAEQVAECSEAVSAIPKWKAEDAAMEAAAVAAYDAAHANDVPDDNDNGAERRRRRHASMLTRRWSGVNRTASF
jgi:hypothetical protein